ncbi:MAG: PASTA domain-containing protein [Leptospiraceae bacterium]|nr:PASTA domain-containing protein [Leptospiraceae bacterium]
MKEFLNKLKVVPALGYLLFITTGLIVFFIAAFLVVLLRTKSAASVMMPDLVGQQYTEVHNELMRLRLKVRIENKRYPEKNDGEIIYQSISAGKNVEAGAKLYLTVNNGVDRVKMPELKGQTLNNAKAALDKILSGETYVSLPLGGVTYIPVSDGQSPETVVGQIPEPGKVITTREKIFLLVTEPDVKDKSSRVDDYKGIPFPLVSRILNTKKIKYKVSEIIPTKDGRENGFVESYLVNSDGSYSFKTFYFDPENKVQSGYEKITYKVDNSKSYKLQIQKMDDESSTQTLFEDISFQKDEELKFVFYREGDVRVSLIGMDGDKEKSFKFRSDL